MTQPDTKGQRKYQHSISLGYNCEIAYNFWRTQKCVESSLFSWTFSSPDTLVNTISHLDMLGSKGFSVAVPVGGIYQDNATYVGFHSRLDNTNNATPEQLKECEEELYSRVRHLAEKFRRIAQTEQDVVYFYKYKDAGEPVEKMLGNVKKIYKALDDLHTHPFTLVVVCEEACALAKAEPADDGDLHIRTVKHFANDACVTESEWDEEGWVRIFAEFPHQNDPLPKWFKTNQSIKAHGHGKKCSLGARIKGFFCRLFGCKSK